MKIQKPTLLLNRQISLNNIHRIHNKIINTSTRFRPHFKTHLSAETGRWFRDLGIKTCAVSSVDMADYFSRNGWADITIAFPVNILQIDKINQIAPECDLQLLVDSEAAINFLKKNLKRDVQKIWIKLDLGYGRVGCGPEETDKIISLITEISSSSRMKFEGFLVHNGHTYDTTGPAQIIQIYQNSVQKIQSLKENLKSRGILRAFKISYGDTPSCSLIDDLSYMDEIRPGNFIFYDLMQAFLGACKESDIALILAAPIVGIYPGRNEIAIHGGGVHLSKEKVQNSSGQWIYGKVVKLRGKSWSESLPDTYLAKISQEHGIIKTSPGQIKDYKIGDLVGILPVHSCLTVNLMKHYYTLQMEKISTVPISNGLS